LDENIEDDISERNRDRGKLKQMTVGFFGASHEKEGKTGWRSPKKMDQVDLRF
jgi:hypothetical protein